MAYKSSLQQEKEIRLRMPFGADSKSLDSCRADLRCTDTFLIFNHIILSAYQQNQTQCIRQHLENLSEDLFILGMVVTQGITIRPTI